MDRLRLPFLVAALVLSALVVLVEVGSPLVTRLTDHTSQTAQRLPVAGLSPSAQAQMARVSTPIPSRVPPGLAIPRMVLLDILLLSTVCLMALPFLLSDRAHGRVVGIVTCLLSLAVIIIGFGLALAVLAELLLMVALFLAPPFGTLAYLAEWGHFRVGAAAALLGTLMALKLGVGSTLLLAHQRFLQNKGLLLLFGTSLLANLVTGFLHGFVPGPLVSITDAIAALVVLILALIWAILMLVFGIISVVKAVA
jgi:hypothetical protein